MPPQGSRNRPRRSSRPEIDFVRQTACTSLPTLSEAGASHWNHSICSVPPTQTYGPRRGQNELARGIQDEHDCDQAHHEWHDDCHGITRPGSLQRHDAPRQKHGYRRGCGRRGRRCPDGRKRARNRGWSGGRRRHWPRDHQESVARRLKARPDREATGLCGLRSLRVRGFRFHLRLCPRDAWASGDQRFTNLGWADVRPDAFRLCPAVCAE